MSKITDLRSGKRSDKRVNLFLDGKFAVSLGLIEVASEGLKVGQELSDDRIQSLLAALKTNRCLDTAYRYLGYRPRSEAELRDRLERRGFAPEEIENTIVKLKEQGYLDDTVFARFWKENRETFNPRSRFATSRELKKKGVADDVVKEVVGEIDEVESAYRASINKAHHLSGLDYEHFYRKLGDYLKYRGFGYGVISQTVKRVWQEIQEAK
jgi:regulatory protein